MWNISDTADMILAKPGKKCAPHSRNPEFKMTAIGATVTAQKKVICLEFPDTDFFIFLGHHVCCCHIYTIYHLHGQDTATISNLKALPFEELALTDEDKHSIFSVFSLSINQLFSCGARPNCSLWTDCKPLTTNTAQSADQSQVCVCFCVCEGELWVLADVLRLGSITESH